MNNVALTYQVETAGASAATIAGLMNSIAVPFPPDVLQAAGLRVTSDSTPAVSPVVRTIDIAFGPSVTATAVATLDNEDRVNAVMMTAAGIDYILPPRVDFIGGNPERIALASAFLNLQAATVADGGGGYSPTSFAVVLGGMGPPTYGTLPVPPPDWQAARGMPPTTGVFPPSVVQALRIAVQGKGYTSAAKIQFVGGIDPTNPTSREAQAVITLFGPHGEILGVQITDPGNGYIRVPKVIVVDPSHSGGGFMIVQPNPITGPAVNPTTTSSGFVAANISPVMGQGIAATVTLTIAAGVVTAATVTGVGSRYTQLPQILVIDPTGSGSGAVIVPRMGVGLVELKTGGKGFKAVPTVAFTPAFKVDFPDTSDQRAPFFQFMQTAIAVSVMSPVSSGVPVLS